MLLVVRRTVTGMIVGSALVDCDSFAKGLAVVAQNILEVSDADVVLLAIRYPNKKGRTPNTLAVIGKHMVYYQHTARGSFMRKSHVMTAAVLLLDPMILCIDSEHASISKCMLV